MRLLQTKGPARFLALVSFLPARDVNPRES